MSRASFSMASSLLMFLSALDLKWSAAAPFRVLPSGVDANRSGSGAPNSLGRRSFLGSMTLSLRERLALDSAAGDFRFDGGPEDDALGVLLHQLDERVPDVLGLVKLRADGAGMRR